MSDIVIYAFLLAVISMSALTCSGKAGPESVDASWSNSAVSSVNAARAGRCAHTHNPCPSSQMRLHLDFLAAAATRETLDGAPPDASARYKSFHDCVAAIWRWNLLCQLVKQRDV
jgi:hypothetical protein